VISSLFIRTLFGTPKGTSSPPPSAIRSWALEQRNQRILHSFPCHERSQWDSGDRPALVIVLADRVEERRALRPTDALGSEPWSRARRKEDDLSHHTAGGKVNLASLRTNHSLLPALLGTWRDAKQGNCTKPLRSWAQAVTVPRTVQL